MIIEDHCLLCGACVNVCPLGALELRSRRLMLHEDRCFEEPCRRWSCGLCSMVCPVEAIHR